MRKVCQQEKEEDYCCIILFETREAACMHVLFFSRQEMFNPGCILPFFFFSAHLSIFQG